MGKGRGYDYNKNDYSNNIPNCTDDYTQQFNIIEFAKYGDTNNRGKAETISGYAIGFVHAEDENKTKYVSVGQNGELGWFDFTTMGADPASGSTGVKWSTNFEFTEVNLTENVGEYGSWDAPTHFGFPVKMTRSDDGKAVVSAEDYNYYATLKLPFAVTLPEDVTAYKLTDDGKKNEQDDVVGLEPLVLDGNVLPRETPVLLSMPGGEGTSYPATKTIYLQPAKHQVMKPTYFNGTLGKKTFTDYDPSINANYFILGKKNGRVAFYYLADQVLAANKAYYVYDGSTSAKTLAFSFQDSPSAIGIPEADDEDDMTAPVFDLAGRRITGKASKGVYIRNGKKFVVR